jgi:hypothetical protein
LHGGSLTASRANDNQRGTGSGSRYEKAAANMVNGRIHGVVQ